MPRRFGDSCCCRAADLVEESLNIGTHHCPTQHLCSQHANVHRMDKAYSLGLFLKA